MDDLYFMDQALELAREAAAEGEVPVGCVIVRNGEIVGRGRNRREMAKTALGHAEIEAIAEANRNLSGWRLWECTLYVTLEPCPMCAGAIVNARIPRVVYGASDSKCGACGSVCRSLRFPTLRLAVSPTGRARHRSHRRPLAGSPSQVLAYSAKAPRESR